MRRVPDHFEDRVICIIGMGYVGVTLAVAMADKGFQIYGVEKLEAVLEQFRQLKPHFFEKDLEEQLHKHLISGRIQVSSAIPARPDTSIYIVTVGTPIGPDKKIRWEPIIEVSTQLGKVMKDNDMVILRSTVKVGATRNVVLPLLQVGGARVDLAFCPERTIEGNALSELSSLPQIVSGITEFACLRAAGIFSLLTPIVVKVSSLEIAELAKLLNNTTRDLDFAFANEVALMCEALDIDVSEVVRATTLHYPRGKLAYPGPVGGPCLEKDPYILAESLEEHSVIPELALLGRKKNEELPRNAVERIHSSILEYTDGRELMNPVIAILGLAFKGKPETDDLRGSVAIPLIKELCEVFPQASIRAYDPVVCKDKSASLGLSLVQVDTLEQAFSGAHVVIIQNNHAQFQKMPIRELALSMSQPAFIYDYWNLFAERKEITRGLKYFGLGFQMEGDEA